MFKAWEFSFFFPARNSRGNSGRLDQTISHNFEATNFVVASRVA
jgi:hypothetical protein